MKLTTQSAEVISTGESNYNEMCKIIELAGRTCYKSLDRITANSALEFVERMKKSKHYSTLEHGTMYLYFEVPEDNQIIKFFKQNKYSVVRIKEDIAFVTTNYRVIVENFDEDEQKKLIDRMQSYSSEFEKRTTVVMTTNLQIAAEYCRHRKFSFNQESTRYCNYSKGKFDNELTFVDPRSAFTKFYYNENGCFTVWMQTNQVIEDNYLSLASKGCVAQECAQILPKDLKTELVMTGTTGDWNHFMDLRYYGKTGAPHPQAKELATKIMEAMKLYGKE